MAPVPNLNQPRIGRKTWSHISFYEVDVPITPFPTGRDGASFLKATTVGPISASPVFNGGGRRHVLESTTSRRTPIQASAQLSH